jgi:hypothetical protein
MDVLAFLIMVLLLLGIGRLVVAALAIQKNTREVADYFQWLRERQAAQRIPKEPGATTKAADARTRQNSVSS